jgi:predicted DNA-binding transcriptional regulator YafY
LKNVVFFIAKKLAIVIIMRYCSYMDTLNTQLKNAVLNQSTVTFSYKGEVRRVTPEDLAPEYVTAFDQNRGAIRRFRLESIRDLATA